MKSALPSSVRNPLLFQVNGGWTKMLAFPHVCAEDTNAHPIRPTFAAKHGILHSLNLISLVFQDAGCNPTAINLRMLTTIGSIAHFHPHACRDVISTFLLRKQGRPYYFHRPTYVTGSI